MSIGCGCPKCGCKRSFVTHTRPIPSGVRRYRVCGNCGKKYRTTEKGPENER